MITRANLSAMVASFVESRNDAESFTLTDLIAALAVPVDVEHIVAALWDLVEDGRLTYGTDARFVCRAHRRVLIPA